MIIRIFRENQALVILLSVFTAILISVYVGIYVPFSPDFSILYHKPLYIYFPSLTDFSGLKILVTIVNLLLVLINGLYLNRLVIKYQLIQTRTSLPLILFFILSAPYFTSYTGLSFGIIALFILQIALEKLFDTAEDKGVAYGYFDSSLLLSVATLLCPYMIFFIPFFLFILVQLKGIRWREFLFVILGIFVPVVLIAGVFYIFEIDYQKIFTYFINISGFRPAYILTAYPIIWISTIGLLFLLSSFKILQDYVKMKVLTRKYSFLFLVLFAFSLLTGFSYPVIGHDYIFLLTLPISFLFTYYFTNCRLTILNQVLFIAFIAVNLLAFVMN